MKRRLKFIWGAGGVVKGRWYLGLLGFYDRVVGAPDSGLAISVRGVLLWLAGLGLAGYIAAATALLFWLDRNPYNQVAFADTVTLPWRWRQFQSLRGQSLIAEGRADMRAGHWSDALFKLRAGLAREPGDLQARLVLAQFYVASNQRPLARRTLDEGMSKRFPGQPYLSMVFSLAAQAEDYALIEAACARYLPQLSAPGLQRSQRWLAQRQLQNFIDVGKPERVLAVAEQESGVPRATLMELRVLALLAMGRADDALSELGVWRGRTPAESQQVLRLLVRAEREAKHYSAMKGALDELVAQSPAEPNPYVYRVVQLTLAGETEAAQVALGSYLLRFGSRIENLRLLAEPLATIKGTAALGRVVAVAREQGFETRGLELMRAQALLEDGEASEASRVLAQIADVRASSSNRTSPLNNPLRDSSRQQAIDQATREWLQVIADAVRSPIPAVQSVLVEAVRKRSMSVAGYRTLSAILRAGDRLATAQTVLRMSEAIYPDNKWIKDQLMELARSAEPKLDDIVAKPVYERPLDEKTFFAQLNATIGASDWASARKLVQDVRKRSPKPVWVSSRDDDLLFAQMRIEHGGEDRMAMLIAAKLYLDGDRRRSQAALVLAQEFYAGGSTEEALMLVKEILRKAPDFPPAERQLAAWTPRKE